MGNRNNCNNIFRIQPYRYTEHGGHIEVLGHLIGDQSKRGGCDVPEASQSSESDEADRRDCRSSSAHLDQLLQKQPGSSPSVHTDHGENVRIQAGAGVEDEPGPVRV